MSTQPSGKFVSGSVDEALRQVQSDFDAIQEALRGNAMIERIADMGIDLIQHRTFDRSEDVRDTEFKPYSGYWACVRDKKGLPTDRVRLRFFGTMFQAIRRTVENPRAAVLDVLPLVGGGNNTTRDVVAESHQRGAGVPKREWFGISPKDHRALEREAAALFTEIIVRQPRMHRLGSDISVLNERYQMAPINAPTADYYGISALGCGGLR